jgi:hypothetical protein
MTKTACPTLVAVFVLFLTVALVSLAPASADSGSQSWDQKQPMPTGRDMHAAAALNGLVYVMAGGVNTCVATNANEVYDPASDSWQSLAPVPRSIHLPEAVADDGTGKIYLLGGRNPCSVRDARVDVYDPATDSWNSPVDPADMLQERDEFGATVLNGKIYVIGGGSESGNERTVQVYDPALDSWTWGTPLPVGVFTVRQSSAATLDGKIWVVATPRSIYYFDPGLNDWVQALGGELPNRDTGQPHESYDYQVVVLQDKLVVIESAHLDYFTYELLALPAVHVYDPATASLYTLPDGLNPLFPVKYMPAVAAGGKAYVVGGEEASPGTKYSTRNQEGVILTPEPPVGGSVDLERAASAPAAHGSDSAAPPYVPLAAGAAALLALTAGAWFVRKRWAR